MLVEIAWITETSTRHTAMIDTESPEFPLMGDFRDTLLAGLEGDRVPNVVERTVYRVTRVEPHVD